VIVVGASVKEGDILVGKVTPRGQAEFSAEEKLLHAIFGDKASNFKDSSLKVPYGGEGVVFKVERTSATVSGKSTHLGEDTIEIITVYIAQKRKIQVGDKIAGRHGNKGVISIVVPQEDMPYLEDGTPIDICYNPLGIPSRMNLGQVCETHIGLALREIARHKLYQFALDNAKASEVSSLFGINDERAKTILKNVKKYFADNGVKTIEEAVKKMTTADYKIILSTSGLELEDISYKAATPAFCGATTEDIFDTMQEAGLDPKNTKGKFTLYDGQTGEPFDNKISVGVMYVMKLDHMIDDKLHARSIGPYSKITQQPLGGKRQKGGRKFGEMEV
jgi:DNA-directed RNA polymerase subunit beta